MQMSAYATRASVAGANQSQEQNSLAANEEQQVDARLPAAAERQPTTQQTIADTPTRNEQLLQGQTNDDQSNPERVLIADNNSGKSNAAIIESYQTAEDTRTLWSPRYNFLGFAIRNPFGKAELITATEARLLDEMSGGIDGIGKLNQFKGIHDDAKAKAVVIYPPTPGDLRKAGNDGHTDAFLHMYWNARMTKAFGLSFATAFATAHEGVPKNKADQEAMDLYNNEVGRKIAVDNPKASTEELATLVDQAIKRGDALVIDGDGELKCSNEVEVGATGEADDAPRPGGAVPPAWVR